MGTKVFISYAKEDAEGAMRLHRDLERSGLEPWLDKANLLPGERWEVAVRKAIRKSSFFIALLSTRAVGKRGFVQKEIRQALSIADEFPQDQVFVIPVRLDDCQPSFEELRALHRVDLFPEYHEGLRALRQVLTNDFEQEHEGDRKTGILSRLMRDRQYGFISTVGIEKDIFFHFKDFATRNLELVSEGMWVSYTLKPGPIGSSATEITLS